MMSLRSPRGACSAVLLAVLRIYLIIIIAGCSSTRRLTVEEVRDLQSREYDIDYETLFETSKSTLQDLNYMVDEIDYESGLITASLDTEDFLGEITTTEDDSMPTWLTVLVIVTGVIVVIGLIALLSGDDDSDDEDDAANHHAFDKEEDESGYFVTHLDIDTGFALREYYNYAVMINVKPVDDLKSKIRVNAQARKIEEGQAVEAGYVLDPQFYDRFFAALEAAMLTE